MPDREKGIQNTIQRYAENCSKMAFLKAIKGKKGSRLKEGDVILEKPLGRSSCRSKSFMTASLRPQIDIFDIVLIKGSHFTFQKIAYYS